MNQVLVRMRIRGVVRREDDLWVAGFPRLDVYSQGDTAKEAKENASDALRLWVASCLDRGTLGDPLRELGWHRYPDAANPPLDREADQDVGVHLEDVLGETWEEEIEVPAYEAAEFLAAGA